jgi:hypothetical protein
MGRGIEAESPVSGVFSSGAPEENTPEMRPKKEQNYSSMCIRFYPGCYEHFLLYTGGKNC